MENEAKQLKQAIDTATDQLKIKDLTKELEDLKSQSQDSQFWTDNQRAKEVMQKIALLEKRINPWLELIQASQELVELAALNDRNLEAEITSNLQKVEDKFNGLKQQLMLAGPYDDHGAVVSISAGAGGTDAQDWTQILFRMYSRFFDKKGWHYRILDQSQGEEAGLKNVVIEVDSGEFIYGRLKGEHGVHRLVRLSPFNADNLRQTSFAKVEVLPMIDSPSEVDIDDKDLKVDVYRSGGHGGQSVNTTDSAVRVTHLPTGISVAIQNERSQLQNKETAMTILRSKLVQLQLEQHTQQLSELKGPNQSAEWGNQIRSYVMHPYKQVKDLRSKYETSDIDSVLNGELEPLIQAFLEASKAIML